MPFIDYETSDEARVVELYIVRYDSEAWYGTSGPLTYVDPVTSRNYTPMGFKRDRIVYGADTSKSSLKVTVPRDAPFLDLFRVQQPSSVVSLTITRVHLNDPLAQQEIIWTGRILAPSWEASMVVLNCERVQASAQRYGLRRIIMVGCPHTLYNQTPGNCRVNQQDYELQTTVAELDGLNVTLAFSGSPLNYYAGGFMQWSHASLAAIERRTILSNEAGTGRLVLATRPTGLIVGSTVRLYPTCDKTLNTCQTKFNNVPNYGGFPYTPNKELFGGDLIY